MGSLQSKVTVAEKTHFGHIRRELGCSIEINLVHKNLVQAIRSVNILSLAFQI